MASTEDYFEDSLLSLFDEHPFAFSTSGPDEPYIYTPPSTTTHPSTPISLTLPIAPSSLHLQLQLTHIWLSSIYLADLIFTGRIDVVGKRCAELGAGAGLPSIAAIRCGARSVVASDYAVEVEEGGVGVEDVLGVLKDNVRKACPQPNCREEREWNVVGHTWATPVDALLSACSAAASAPYKPELHSAGSDPSTCRLDDGRFDTLLLADLLWSSASHTALITSVLALLRPSPPSLSSHQPSSNPTISSSSTLQAQASHPPTTDRGGTAHVIAGLHAGRGPVERFKSAWREHGGWVEERGEVRWGRGGEWEGYERPKKVSGRKGAGEEEQGQWADAGMGEERGVVVWFEIGLGDLTSS